jgi:hypothetical protein
MTPEAQRIAIAEVCGWDVIEVIDGLPFGILDSRIDKSPRLVPDYLNNLNAMHEAENKLPTRLWGAYETYLREVCHIPDRENNTASKPHFYRATAAQRAEAFLKTLGLWEEHE